MKKLMIAAVIGALSTTMLTVATDAAAQTATTTKPAAKATAKRPQPKRLIKRKANPAKEAKVDPVPEGSEKWSCNEGLAFELKGDMKRDQIVTVNWANKNYNLPREDDHHGRRPLPRRRNGHGPRRDPDQGNVVLGQGQSRLADECKTASMQQGAPAPTQSNALDKTSNRSIVIRKASPMSAPISNVRPEPDSGPGRHRRLRSRLRDRQHARLDTARNCLIDTLGCGLEALNTPPAPSCWARSCPAPIVPNGAQGARHALTSSTRCRPRSTSAP